MDAYCPAHPEDPLIEIDDRLYPAERLYFDENHGRDCLCSEAERVVSVLREQVDVRFFNQRDTSRNLLTSAPVLMSAAISPGTCKLCRAVSKMMDRTGLYEQAVLEVRVVCDRLTEPAVPTSTAAAPSARCAPRHRRAYTSPPDFTDDEESLGNNVAPESMKATMAKSQLEEFLSAVCLSKIKDPLLYWKQNKSLYFLMYPVACAVLGAVATSAASERDFSIAGNIMRKERSALLSRHLEMHTLVRENARFLSKSLTEVPKLTHETAHKVDAEMPQGRSTSVQDDTGASTADEDSNI